MANYESPKVPRPKSDKDSQVTLTLPGAWLEEAQRLAELRSEPGLAITRADVLRMALRRGLDAIDDETSRAKTRPRSRK